MPGNRLFHDFLKSDDLLQITLHYTAVFLVTHVFAEGDEFIQKGIKKDARVFRFRARGEDVDDA